jgi:replication factor C large subunit
MWSYASELMSAGVALAREGKLKYVKFQPPSSGMLYRRTAAKRAVRDSLARKIAARCHTSGRVAREHFIPYFGIIFKHDQKAGNRIAAELELGDAEVDYLKGLK